MGKKRGAPQPIGEMQADGNWQKTTWIPQIDPSDRIQVGRLQRALSVEKRAAADALLNQPDGADTTLNAPQLEICNRIFKGVLVLNQFLSDQIGLAVQNARQLTSARPDVERTNDRITGAIEEHLGEQRAELVRLRLQDLSRQRGLRFFRLTNGLHRAAHYKESPALVIGILLFVFMAESMVNGSLLASVMADGLAGGAVMAGLISFINIITGALAGVVGWRLIGHAKPVLKGLGALVAIILHSAAIAWNVFIAHFREVAEIAAAQPDFNFDMAAIGAATLEHMDVNGLSGMGSVQAWALLILGLLIHFLAAKEGWDDFADRYWDYKKVDKAARDAREAFADALADVRAAARNTVEQVEAEVEREALRAENNLQALSALLDLAQQRRQEVKDSEDEWVAGGTQLLKIYRAANTQVRDQKTAPAYFTVFPTAADYRRRDFGAELEPSGEVEQRMRLLDQSMAELHRLRDSAAAAAETASEALAAVRRHSTQAIRKLDKRLEQEDRAVTLLAEKQLEIETEGLGAANDERVNNAAA